MIAAKIENGTVVDLIVIGDPSGLAWAMQNLGGEWVNGIGAEIGYVYVDGSFIPQLLSEDLDK
jgi:hypothetical protein